MGQSRFSFQTSRGPIVVTGATGFIGANLCRFLHQRGAQVMAVEGPSLNKWRLPADGRLQLARVDLCSQAEVERFFQSVQPEVVINCAAYGAYSVQTNVAQMYRVNLDAVRNILESLRRVERIRAFIQAGSSSEYGFHCRAPAESEPTSPDSHYAVAKVAASALIKFYACKFGLPGWTLRMYSVYGPLEDSSRLIPRVLAAARDKQLPPLVDPRISRDFVFIEDAYAAFEAVAGRAPRLKKGEIFNIGAGKEVTLRSLVSTVRKLFGIVAKPSWGSMPNRHWDHPHWYANPSKAHRVLGWKARTSLEAGLLSTMGWMESNPDIVRAAEANSIVKRALNE